MSDLLKQLIIEAAQDRNWVSESKKIELLEQELKKLNRIHSVRAIGLLIDKSKSWVCVSLLLARGIRVYPELEKLASRSEAYKTLLRKRKMQRFLES